MNVLLISSRFPWPSYTGDRLRASIWLSALERDANVSLVSPAGQIPLDAPQFRFHAAAPSAFRAASAAFRILGGAPVQSLLAAPYDWEGAIARARNDAGGFDVTIVLLSRLDPWVRAFRPDGFFVLDAIDSLRRSMAERSRESSPPARWFWRAESRRVARAEAGAVRAYDRVVVVSAEDCGELDAVAIANGVRIAPLTEGARPFDFGFWGRLAYFANADAVEWLFDEIWPAIRRRRPNATLLIAGADAPARIRAADGCNGIVVRSPAGDIAALAREVKVAIVPMRYGTGQSNKVLEAAEGGCAIVATRKAMRGLDALTKLAIIADDAQELARSAVAAIADDSRRAAMGKALHDAVETSYARRQTLDRLASIVQRREVAA
jgi:glycosyltransferase involved in cell wall biosynthesis